ncbi:MAG: 30S ribosomal protein S15 [Candidatus Chaera renei]|uniref:Small ribosomal subunit protein uS15 n=1 Tax=Candidatus Chaera renei TaxID=2506947 RepID=A0A4Q0AJI2_9BACT|nr:MAG: 30S ribosomal protein S15 [Candidatus Chaera renei]
MITAVKKQSVVKEFGRHQKDAGSSPVQAAILTARIKEITEHLKLHKQDNKARRGLLKLVGQRKKLLAYLEKTDFEGYQATVTKLGLRK